jgi:hypothetical protein
MILKLFGKNQSFEFSLSEQHRLSVQRHNEQVREIRITFTHLIKSVCVLGKLELAFRGHDESETSDNRGNYVEMLKLLGNYEADMKFLVKIKAFPPKYGTLLLPQFPNVWLEKYKEKSLRQRSFH